MDYAIIHKQVSAPKFVIFPTLAAEINSTLTLPRHQKFFFFFSPYILLYFPILVSTVLLQTENTSQE